MLTRHDWTRKELKSLYELPFPELLYRAQTVHRNFFPVDKVQRSTLLSVKTGGCPEDCAYCPQSAHHDAEVQGHGILSKEDVLKKVQTAKKMGSTRFCMGAAWKGVREGREFDEIIGLIESVAELGLEVCCTLGMLSEDQAEKLKKSGCKFYNHNLDTAPEYYGNIVSTRTYEDRRQTLKNVRKAGIQICCGGILGMGESIDHRIGLLEELAIQMPHPESVPINVLVPVKGTPLENEQPVEPIEFVRIIATARIAMPKSFIRLSAGRTSMSDELQALCFLAGANSIFSGEKLLTTSNPSNRFDENLFAKLGMSFLSLSDLLAIEQKRKQSKQ